MSWFRTSPTPQKQQATLQRRLAKLHRVFDVPALRAESLRTVEVVDYYEQCHDAYRKYHSSEGAVHMALNDGSRFDAEGFKGQLHRLRDAWRETPPTTVLELAFGQGYNLAWLAPQMPETQFVGIDLTPVHLTLAQQRMQALRLPNVTLQLGDYHALPHADASFDAVFCIEAFCHALDLPGAFSQVARVLRPGGTFTLFDGYLPRHPKTLQPHEALAVELVARGMAIEQLQVQSDLLDAAAAAGLETVAVHTLDQQVLPGLRRLQRTTGAVVRFAWLGRRALARRPAARGRNVLAGYLLRDLVEMGLMGYRHIVLRKAG